MKTIGEVVVMSHMKLFLVPFLAFTLATPAMMSNAAPFFTVASLNVLCGSDDEQTLELCKFYLHGVVETWMFKDLVGVDPMRYQSRGSFPEYCDTIGKVSDDEWVRVIRNELDSMEDTFATDAVMDSLANTLCK